MFSKRINNIILSILFIFSLLPLVAGLGYALFYSLGLTGVLNTGFTLKHWATLFKEGNVLLSFGYSALVAVASIIIAVALSIVTALRLHGSLQKGLTSYLIYIPLAFPGIVAAFFFFQLFTKAGILSRLAYTLNITSNINEFPDLVNDQWGIGMICSFVFLAFPFFVLLYVNIINSERLPELKQMASTLGANKNMMLWRLSVPVLLRKSLPNIILYFIFIFGAFEVPLLLGRSNPEAVSVLAVRKLQRFNLLDLPQGYAVAVLYSIFVLAAMWLLFKTKNLANEN